MLTPLQALLFATMDLSNEVGGSVVGVARDLFLSKLLPRALSGMQPATPAAADGSTPMAVDAPLDACVGPVVKLLASELSSPDQNVRAQV